jgi:homoserine O-acetyltransferase
VVRLRAPFALHHGGTLESPRIAWRLIGPSGAPVVLAIGGISGHRRVGAEDEGWWAPVVGRGRALDTARFRVLGIDYLGGSGSSTAPVPGSPFPSVSAFDQARAIAVLVAELGLGRLHAVIGASYGGQVALAIGARHAALASRLVVLSAADRTHPMASAWRSVEREIVRFGIRHGDPAGGLKLARSLAMCTYRTPREFATRFSGEPALADGRLQLPVEGYLFARGDAYVARYRPESFVCLSESIDLFRIDAAEVRVPVTAIAVPEDQLVPYADMQAFIHRLPAGRLVTLESVFGHDAFLKEAVALRPIFAECLEEPAR